LFDPSDSTTCRRKIKGRRAGGAHSIDEAKEELLRAWPAWLEWAELGRPVGGPSEVAN
jgi:hypothetical protein